MQAYFDRDDAHLEADALITQSASDRDSEDGSTDFGRRRYLNLVGYTAGLGLLALILVIHLGSAEPALSTPKPDPKLPEVHFIIEIPEPEPEKPKPKPKPKVEPPKPKPVERLRSIPDQTMHEVKPRQEIRKRDEAREIERDVEQEITQNRKTDKTQKRSTVNDSKRDVESEETTERSLPAVKTPTIVAQETAVQRDVSREAIRQSTVSALAKTTGEFVEEIAPRASRGLPDEGLSRVNLDPYTYQMVNVCLRMCTKSMFTHTGMDAQEQESSSAWLRVKRDQGNSSFSYRFGGRWVEVGVNVGSLADISNLNFIDIPSELSNGGKADAFLSEVTRKLCSLLGYDDCVERL